jgi:hypothetical protein
VHEHIKSLQPNCLTVDINGLTEPTSVHGLPGDVNGSGAIDMVAALLVA